MTNTKKKKKGKFSVVAGITGAIVGAGAAVATAVALKDKKNRDKVKKAFTNVKDKALGYVKKIQKEVKKEKK
jgi:hypothetical protein